MPVAETVRVRVTAHALKRFRERIDPRGTEPELIRLGRLAAAVVETREGDARVRVGGAVLVLSWEGPCQAAVLTVFASAAGG